VREISETIGISKERAGYILREDFDMKKLCASWVTLLLTEDQKHTRMIIPEQCLERRFITMDENWIHHYTPESSSRKIGQKPVVQRQRRQGRFHQQEKSWHRCFGMLKAFCLLIILKRVKQ